MNEFHKYLYEIKMQLLFNKGLNEKRIVPFDNEFYEKMSHTYFNGIPISMHIKYLRPTIGPGKCYDRSLYMFFCFDNAILVRADTKILEQKYGKENAGYGWIEIDDYVYDPTLLLRFERDLYYEIYNPSNITMCTKETYGAKEYYEKIRSTTIEDLKNNMEQQANLIVSIPIIQEIAKYSKNQDFIDELNEYLEKINYNYDESIKKLNKHLSLK